MTTVSTEGVGDCRICLDNTPPLLTNVCDCRGSQQWIHASCLLAWMHQKPTTICDICRTPFAFQAIRKVAVRPLGESVLFSELFQWSMNFLLLGLFFTSSLGNPSLLLSLQRILFTLFFVSYSYPLAVSATTYRHYGTSWFLLYLRLPTGRYIFPLPVLCFFFLPVINPFVYSMAAFQGIWYIHVGILLSIEAQQQQQNLHQE